MPPGFFILNLSIQAKKDFMKSFASDNHSGIHPDIVRAIAAANTGHCKAYGADDHTASALGLIKKHFGAQAEGFFVFNGTGANVLSLQALTKSHQAILCSELAHIQVDECGAPEKFTGCKLIGLPHSDGKIRVSDIEKQLAVIGSEHQVQPKVVSISQSTELGTVYTLSEIRAIAQFCKANGLFFHMDGARLSNAAASLGVSLREITEGVDIVSFGGTKNGLMLGECVVVLSPSLAGDLKFTRKQGMQLSSKMRFIAAQFTEFLSNDLWLKNAQNANRMARLLESKVREIPSVKISRPVEANAVFAMIPPDRIAKLQAQYFFYVWDVSQSEVRWVTSFDTTEQDVLEFAQAIHSALK